MTILKIHPTQFKLPLSNEKFSCLQDKDLKVRQLKQKVIQGQYAQFYFIKKGVLYRSKPSKYIKTINAVKKDNLMHVFNFPEDVYDSAWAQATGEEDPGSSGNTSD